MKATQQQHEADQSLPTAAAAWPPSPSRCSWQIWASPKASAGRRVSNDNTCCEPQFKTPEVLPQLARHPRHTPGSSRQAGDGSRTGPWRLRTLPSSDEPIGLTKCDHDVR